MPVRCGRRWWSRACTVDEVLANAAAADKVTAEAAFVADEVVATISSTADEAPATRKAATKADCGLGRGEQGQWRAIVAVATKAGASRGRGDQGRRRLWPL